MRRTMTDRGVAALKRRAQRYAVSDPELRGHWIRVQPSGAKTFVAVTRDPNGKQLWTTIGATDAMSIDAAREQARSILQRVRAGRPAFEPKAQTFGAVVDNWLKRHVEANSLRSGRYPTTQRPYPARLEGSGVHRDSAQRRRRPTR